MTGTKFQICTLICDLIELYSFKPANDLFGIIGMNNDVSSKY